MNIFLMIVMQSSILIIALLGIRKVFLGRISPILQHALWGLVALRLFIPIRIESVLSIFNFTHFSVAEHTSVPAAPAAPQIAAATLPQINSTAPQAAAPPAAVTAPAAESISFEALLPWIWFIGMTAVLVYIFIVNLRFYRFIAKYGKQHESYILCDRLSSPCLIGFFRPRIVLNKKAVSDEAAKKYALLHEQMHLHHADHVWTLLRTLACIIYWFNPLVWIAAHFSRMDQELACDHAVICRIGEEKRIEYGEILLSLIRRSKTLPTLTTAMAGNKKIMRQRIKLIADRPKMLRFTAVILIAITLVVCIVSCTSSPTNKMPYEISAEDVFEPVFHYDRDLNSANYKEHPLEEASAEEIISLLNNSAEIEKAEYPEKNGAYISLDIKGGGIIAIRPAADGEHIFFKRDNQKWYKAKNPALAEYIAEQIQAVTATDNTAASAEKSEEVPVPGPARAQSAYYESMDELVSRSSFIFIGKVENVTCKKIAEYKNKTHSEVTVTEAIKGSLNPNETITVTQSGGYADGYDMIIMENGRRVPYPSADTEYLFFLSEKKAPMNPFVGFSKIENGTVYPDEDNNIITAPTPLEDVRQQIADSMEQTTEF